LGDTLQGPSALSSVSPLGTLGEVLQGGAPDRCATPGTSTTTTAVPVTSTQGRPGVFTGPVQKLKMKVWIYKFLNH
jgi:hypothetical protein